MMNCLAIILLCCQLASLTAQSLEQLNARVNRQQETLGVLSSAIEQLQDSVKTLQATLLQLTSKMNGMQVDINVLHENPCQCKVSAKPVCRLTTNLALGKPTSQSTTYPPHYGANSLASNAVDGNRNPNYEAKSCAVTYNNLNEWWAVDLQTIVNVNSVNITNRLANGHRLHDFYVTLTDVSPELVAPKPGGGKECAFQKAVVPGGATVQFNCPIGTVGRYVVVQNANHAEFLQLCEVEVYGCA